MLNRLGAGQHDWLGLTASYCNIILWTNQEAVDQSGSWVEGHDAPLLWSPAELRVRGRFFLSLQCEGDQSKNSPGIMEGISEHLGTSTHPNAHVGALGYKKPILKIFHLSFAAQHP